MSLRGLLEAIVVVALAIGSFWIVGVLVGSVQPVGADFAPVWVAAANPDIAYDVSTVTSRQPEFRNFGPRPFAYPPSALLLFLPLGSLPFPFAYLLFASIGFALFVWSAWKSGAAWWIMLFPPVLMAAHIGQPSLLVGGAILAGMFYPAGRGALFGAAAAMKPQLCIFLPLVFLFERDWRNAVMAFVVLLSLCLISSAAFGLRAWGAWFEAANDLAALATTFPPLSRNMIHSNPLVFAVPAFLLVWLTKRADTASRFGSLIGAALLVSPYAMHYELALLAPALAQRGRPGLWPVGLALGLTFYRYELAVLLLCLIAIGLAALRPRRPFGWLPETDSHRVG